MKANELDARVDAIRTALSDLRIADLKIEVVDGIVYLHGVAGCYDTKRRASEIAREAAPAENVCNEMRVAQTPYADDRTLSREVMQAIGRLGRDVLERVRVEVCEGVVYLYGTARDAEERKALASAAWAGSCVSRVENHLMLKEDHLADTEVARSLNQYVQRAMNLPRGIITVSYSSGVALLTGSVPSETQCQAIEELVRWHDQVSDVINKLRIVPAMHPRTGARRVH
jgi:osmotically-inducible protein OsmY